VESGGFPRRLSNEKKRFARRSSCEDRRAVVSNYDSPCKTGMLYSVFKEHHGAEGSDVPPLSAGSRLSEVSLPCPCSARDDSKFEGGRKSLPIFFFSAATRLVEACKSFRNRCLHGQTGRPPTVGPFRFPHLRLFTLSGFPGAAARATRRNRASGPERSWARTCHVRVC